MRSLLRIAGGAALLLTLALASRPALAATTGNIEGVVTDQASGKKLAGVTVTVTSPALQGEQTEFTDAGGHYIITELPPGEYLVRFYFSNINVERPGVFIQADKTLPVNVAIPTQKAEVKTYRITEKAPTVDVGNTQIQTQVTSELVRNTPVKGRTYDAILSLAPGAATDATGFEFNGATGLENNFLIDGVNTTSPAFGNLGTQLTLEFIGETEIITGGYNAEYGRATGGVVNVITKSGSNQFHGGIWFYGTPPQVLSPYIGRSGEAIVRRDHTKYALDFGFDLGGPIVKDKIWFYVGFAPTFTTNETTRYIRMRSAATEAAAKTGGDLDTNVNCPGYIDRTFCSATNPSLLAPGFKTTLIPGAGTNLDTDIRLYNWIAKLNFQLNANNSLVLQYIGSPGTSNGITTTAAGVTGQQFFGTLNGSLGQTLGEQFDNTHDALLHFVSKLADRRLQLDVVAGYHYGDHNTTPGSAAGKTASVLDNRVQNLYDLEGVKPCVGQTIGATAFNPCPVQNYYYGGFGYLQHSTEQRVSAAASATYFARLGGTHALKVGFDFEDNFYKDSRYYTDGAAYTIRPSGSIRIQTYATKIPDAADNRGEVLPGGFNTTTNTLNFSVYARDSYNVGFIPGLTLNAGVRWEAQQVRDVHGDVAIGIYDNWAPRVGAVYDFTRKGRSKIYVSYGWFYESIPLDINDRQFSGEGIGLQTAKAYPSMGSATMANATTYCVYGGMGFLDPKNCVSPQPSNASINGGSPGQVSPKLRGMYSEEVVAGIQYDVGLDMVLGAAYIHRDLGRIIEDISPDGGSTYIIANPGDTTDQATVKDLQNKIKNATDMTVKQSLQQKLGLYQGVSAFPKAVRNYDALVLTATKRLSHNFLLLASYTYSRTIGNYPGLYQASDGQTDPNISTQYDLRELLLNRKGPLPSDRPHNVKIQGSYFIPFGGNTVTLGLAFNGNSGRPIEVLGAHPFYGRDEVFILPRGSGGRTPFFTSFDFHVSYRRQLSRLFGFEAYADVFNLFNQQAITNVDDEYTASPTGPIQNGTVADLAHLKDITGGQVLLNPNYAHATQYQAPLSARIGVRVSF